MKGIGMFKSGNGHSNDWEALDPELRQSLSDFKASVHAWSDAAQNRPHALRNAVAHRTWRLAAGWALAVVLVAAAVSGGLYERHQRQEQAKIAAQQQAAEQRAQATQRVHSTEDLLSTVDTDVSRDVPAAMQPLASLMTDNGNEY